MTPADFARLLYGDLLRPTPSESVVVFPDGPSWEHASHWKVTPPTEHGRDNHADLEFENLDTGEWFTVTVTEGYKLMTCTGAS